MNVPQDPLSEELLSLHRLSSQLLRHGVNDDRKGSVLVIMNKVMPPPACPCLLRDEHSFGLALCIRQGEKQPAVKQPDLKHHSDGQQGDGQQSDGPYSEGPGHVATDLVLDCASTALPFQDEVFRTVILFQVTRDGSEQELAEACRVLTPGGDLLLLGINRVSWSGMKTRRTGSVPVMQVTKVRHALEARGMVIDGVLGAGLLGHARPRMDSNHISGVVLSFADHVLLHARHRERPLLTRMRLKEFPAGVVPTAMFPAPTICSRGNKYG